MTRTATTLSPTARGRGPLIAFLDSDDAWRPDELEREVDVLARHTGAHAAFSDLERHAGSVVVPSFMRASLVFGRWPGDAACPEG